MATTRSLKNAIPPSLEKALHRLPRETLLAFDFDGTLAPIRRDPEKAHLPKLIARKLEMLSRHHPVAVISGRALFDLETKFPGMNLYLIGSHGFETRSPEGKIGKRGSPEWKRAARIWKDAFAHAIKCAPELRGVTIEDKVYSLTLHFRGVRNETQALQAAYEISRALTPSPRLVDGYRVLNLVPADSADKGKALHALMKEIGVKTAVFVGDDITDEHVFEKKIPGVLGIRILAGAGKSSARHRLSTRGSVRRLLRILIQDQVAH